MAGGVRAGGRLSYTRDPQHGPGRPGRAYVLHGIAQRWHPDAGGLEALVSVKYAGLSLYLAALHGVVYEPLYSHRFLANDGVPAPLLLDQCVRAVRLLLCARQWRAFDWPG